jgi:hypothetical protein
MFYYNVLANRYEITMKRFEYNNTLYESYAVAEASDDRNNLIEELKKQNRGAVQKCSDARRAKNEPRGV